MSLPPLTASGVLGHDLVSELDRLLCDHVEVAEALVAPVSANWATVELVVVLGIALNTNEPPSPEAVLTRLCDVLHPRLRVHAPHCVGIRFVTEEIWERTGGPAVRVFRAARRMSA